MKRFAYVLGALGLVATSPAHAQLTMQMSNGWAFTFSGNVNAFLTYEKSSSSGDTATPFGVVPAGDAIDQTRIQTGLLPAFAVFDAKGKEGDTDLSVHFGFAPQINCGRGIHDCFGAQIDMRQVFLTAGGSWGQVLAGRELALFGRQNILTDQTLFGVGATGASGAPGSGGGTTLGRTGFGYDYPQFVAQMTYSTPGGKASQFSIGVFEAAINGPYTKTNVPRFEAEYVYNKDNFKGWIDGLFQTNKDPDTGTSASSSGLAGGLRYGNKQFSILGSGFWGKGIGTTLLYLGGACTDGTCGNNGSTDLRDSFGYIIQATFTSGKTTFAGSYGANILKSSDTENNAIRIGTPLQGKFETENALISAGVYHQATKSLKVVFEFDYATTKDKDAPAPQPDKNSSWAIAGGLMLFF